MARYPSITLVLLALSFALIVQEVSGDELSPPAPAQMIAAVERGLRFLQDDAAKWRKERECSTCHHGTMTVWALSEAKSRGYAVADETFADVTAWTKARLERIDLPRDTRPGWSMVNTPAMYLAVMAQAVPGQQAISADELQRIAGHLLRHQEEDGSWTWASAPPVNRPPPFFESDEVATLLARLALAPPDPSEASPIRDARQRAAEWLAKTPPNDMTQAAALRLVSKVQAGVSKDDLQPDLQAFLKRQNSDGGWSQIAERDSDAYATGQSLYVLGLAGIGHDRSEVQRGQSFLVSSQKEDGSWPMTRRGHPGVTPSANIVPITYFGSAWATLGLMRSSPKVEQR